MAVWRYKIIFECWLKNISWVSMVNKWNICHHKKINSISSGDHVIFFLLCKIFTIHNKDFGDFLKISNHFPKISKDFSKFIRRPVECFWTFSEDFQSFPKITKDCRRLLKKMQRWFDHTPTNLSAVKGTEMLSKMMFSRAWIIMKSS